MATANQVASGALVRGIRPADLIGRRAISDLAVQPALEGLTKDQIAIGSRMAYRMGVGPRPAPTGSRPRAPTALGTVPRIKAYEIGAIFEVGMYEYDNSVIFMLLEAAFSCISSPTSAPTSWR